MPRRRQSTLRCRRGPTSGLSCGRGAQLRGRWWIDSTRAGRKSSRIQVQETRRDRDNEQNNKSGKETGALVGVPIHRCRITGDIMKSIVKGHELVPPYLFERNNCSFEEFPEFGGCSDS